MVLLIAVCTQSWEKAYTLDNSRKLSLERGACKKKVFSLESENVVLDHTSLITRIQCCTSHFVTWQSVRQSARTIGRSTITFPRPLFSEMSVELCMHVAFPWRQRWMVGADSRLSRTQSLRLELGEIRKDEFDQITWSKVRLAACFAEFCSTGNCAVWSKTVGRRQLLRFC